ncbi:hypothetical protein [Flavobacterium inviolabile]|uniref:hypothetical protein n=1 Tax=Flavobacterium inviolabile TaxID=2748320 RepID=UPI0015B1A586|nr:hypothetical protein [Flavobacterium inviolabile]
MRILTIILILFLVGCNSIKNIELQNSPAGTYILRSDKLYQALSDNNYSQLELNPDGTFKLFKAEITFSPVVEQCEIASKGKWTVLSNDLLELNSEDKYLKQKGFEYDLKKENKFSQDSLYIQVNFPSDYHPVRLNFHFNNNNSKSVKTNKTFMAIPKSMHLWDRKITANLIRFSMDADVSGTALYRGRILFSIFEEYIDTEKYNCLTITLPYFDRCFLEFEPYQELIYIKDKNKLQWKGQVWEREIK